jgi:hypothetical protein
VSLATGQTLSQEPIFWLSFYGVNTSLFLLGFSYYSASLGIHYKRLTRPLSQILTKANDENETAGKKSSRINCEINFTA